MRFVSFTPLKTVFSAILASHRIKGPTSELKTLGNIILTRDMFVNLVFAGRLVAKEK